MTHLRAITTSKSLKLEFAYDPNIDIDRKTGGDQFIFDEKTLRKKLKDIDLAVIAAPTEIRRILIETITRSANIQRILCEKLPALDLVKQTIYLNCARTKKLI